MTQQSQPSTAPPRQRRRVMQSSVVSRTSLPSTTPSRHSWRHRTAVWLCRRWRMLTKPSGCPRRTLRWVLRAPGQLSRWIWAGICRITTWVWHELIPPVACLLAIYAGVCLTVLLPASMWAWFALPVVAQLTGAPVVAFPLAELPDQVILIRALLTAIPLAVRVFATGGYQEWKESREALGARLLYACHAGIIWPRAWWRGARHAPAPPAP